METASVSFNEGIRKILRRDYAGAIVDFTQSIKEEPANTAAYNNRGFAKNKLNDTAGEIEDYTKAIEINSEDATAWYNRGLAKERAYDYSGAIEDFTQVIELRSNDAIALYHRALARDKNGEFTSSIEDFTAALEIDSTLKPFYRDKDFRSINLRKYVLAVIETTKSIAENPEAYLAYYKRGVAKRLHWDYSGAIADLTKTIQFDPLCRGAYLERGKARFSLKAFAKAIKDYTKVIELSQQITVEYNENYLAEQFAFTQVFDKDDLTEFYGSVPMSIDQLLTDAFFGRAFARKWMKFYDGALSDFNSLIEFDPKNIEALNARSEMKDSLNDYAGAVADLTKVIELKPLEAKYFYERGKIRDWHLKDYIGAIEDYTIALAYDPEFYEAYSSRGIAKQSLGDLSGALNDCDRIIEMVTRLDPAEYEDEYSLLELAYFSKAIFQKESGDYLEAIKDYSAAIELNPCFFYAYSGRAAAKLELKDFSGAISDSTAAIKIDKKCSEAFHIRGIAKMALGREKSRLHVRTKIFNN